MAPQYVLDCINTQVQLVVLVVLYSGRRRHITVMLIFTIMVMLLQCETMRRRTFPHRQVRIGCPFHTEALAASLERLSSSHHAVVLHLTKLS